MRKLIAKLAALAAAPIVLLAALQTAAPALADTPGVSPTCFPQTANPHPTDPAGSTTAVLFCTAPTPTASASAGSGSGGSRSGSGRSNGTGTGAGTTAGSGQTSLAGTTGSGSAGSAPDESTRFNWASGSNGATSGSGQPATSTDTGLFGGLVGFFSATGGVLFLFGLLLLMLIILAAVGITAWLRRGHAPNWASRFSRVTHRP